MNTPALPEPVQDNIYDTGWRQTLYRFDNSFGASVLRKTDAERFHVALIRWTDAGEEWHTIDSESVFGEHLAGLGYLPGLTGDRMCEVLTMIQALPAPPGLKPSTATSDSEAQDGGA